MARARKKRTRKPVTKAPSQKVPPRLQDALGIGNLLTAGAASPQEIDDVLSLLREQAEEEIEKLIAFVDRIAPDPDLEPSLGYYRPDMPVDAECDDEINEASLGWTDQEARWGRYSEPHLADLEVDDSDHEANGDEREPSLGSIEVHPYGYTTQGETRGLTNQENWAAGNRNDAEGDEHDGSEPDVDDEPCLGSYDRLANQAHAWKQIGQRLVFDGEQAAEIPTAELDSRRAAYKAKHKYPYNGVGGVIIPIRR